MHFTGRPVFCAIWMAMRSQASSPNFAPKPPPTNSDRTRTFEASSLNDRAASPWTLCVPCVEHQIVRLPAPSNSATDPCGSSATWSWTLVA